MFKPHIRVKRSLRSSRTPENRTEIVDKTAKKLKGKLTGSWLSFGEYDLVMTVEMPDNISMAFFRDRSSGWSLTEIGEDHSAD